MGVVLLKRKLTSFQIIILGFSGVILFGTFLLMLPFSSRSGLATPFSDALFTSTSAVCVTGLIIHDTATYWSAFGQFVILLLIQIGGMGVITVAASFAMISGRKISLMQRSTMQEAISAPKVGGIVRLTGFIVRVTLVMELLCAAVMAPVFCRDFGKKGLWMALFHSVSAFCNAGFDLLGVRTPFSSLTSYAANPVINLTIMFLIVFGGIGFLTWDDIRTNRLHLRKYRMQSKVILCTTAVLLIAPAMYFYFFEFADLTRKERLLSSLFQAVTPRTAGFNTVDLTDLSEAGQFITIALMLIGGSPGSTAGGLKTTTIAVLLTTAISTFRRRENANLFGRRIDDDVVKNAATISLMYITPGDPVDSLLGDNATPEAREALREELGLNGGYFERFFNYVVRLLRGDMGICYSTRQNVATRIAQTFPNTVKLASFAVAFAVVFGLTFGIVSAIRQYSIIDNIVMSISMIGISMPSFWCGLLLMLLFCVKLKWLPASGFDSFSCVILPGIALGVNSAASIARMTRSSMLEVIRQDYISTARAKGLSEFKVVTVHALKNALIPVITTIGMQFGLLLGGAVLIESIFAIPGVGKMMVDAIKSRNYPVVQGGVLVIALSFCLVNLVVDILYAYVDPRVRSQYK